MSEATLISKRIQNLAILAKEKVGSFLSGNRRSLYLGHGTEFADIREYVHGDEFRHIDWNQSAKHHNKLFVKEYEVERNSNVVFILDSSASMLLGKKEERIKPASISIASLAHAVIQNKDFFGFASFSDEKSQFLAPRGGKEHEFLIYRRLLNIIPGGKTDLGESIKTVAATLKKRSILIILTDLHLDLDELFKGLKIAKGFKHDVTVIQITDRGEFILPSKVGKIKFKHPSSGDQTIADFTDPIISGRYSYEINKVQREIYRFIQRLRGMKIRVVTSFTENLTEKFLLAYFSHKQRGR